MAGSPQERILAAELVVVMTAEAVDALSGAQSGTVALPDPGRFFATAMVYTLLAAAALFGPKPAKLAAAFGGVAALAILLAPTKDPTSGALTGTPLAISFVTYAGQIIGGGVLGNSTTSTPATPSSGSSQYGPQPGGIPKITQTRPGTGTTSGSAGAGITQTRPGTGTTSGSAGAGITQTSPGPLD